LGWKGTVTLCSALTQPAEAVLAIVILYSPAEIEVENDPVDPLKSMVGANVSPTFFAKAR
jgi:hypothetical protein